MTNQKVFTYLTLILKPEGLEDEALLKILEDNTTRPKPDLARALCKALPCIIAELTPAEGAACVNAITEAGGEACATSLVDLQVHGELTLARNIIPGSDHFGVESWQNETLLLDPRELTSIVLAVVRPNERSPRDPRGSGPGALNQASSAIATGGMVPASRMDSVLSADAIRRTGKADPMPVAIDLHFTGGSPRRLIRLDGRKQGWQFLGEAREHGDRANAIKACSMFQALAPHATTDECYGDFSCPGSARWLRVPGVPPELRNFDFYSRWIGHVHRVLLGHAPAS
ncbi:MAG: hypothetical protein MK085_05980 [Phycisphaerales bacterium]|nr:hypothetical protein [Phycisphaerales bacterium]